MHLNFHNHVGLKDELKRKNMHNFISDTAETMKTDSFQLKRTNPWHMLSCSQSGTGTDTNVA